MRQKAAEEGEEARGGLGRGRMKQQRGNVPEEVEAA